MPPVPDEGYFFSLITSQCAKVKKKIQVPPNQEAHTMTCAYVVSPGDRTQIAEPIQQVFSLNE